MWSAQRVCLICVLLLFSKGQIGSQVPVARPLCARLWLELVAAAWPPAWCGLVASRQMLAVKYQQYCLGQPSSCSLEGAWGFCPEQTGEDPGRGTIAGIWALPGRRSCLGLEPGQAALWEGQPQLPEDGRGWCGSSLRCGGGTDTRQERRQQTSKICTPPGRRAQHVPQICTPRGVEPSTSLRDPCQLGVGAAPEPSAGPTAGRQCPWRAGLVLLLASPGPGP